MDRQQHTSIIQQLRGLVSEENQATATQLLTQLSDDYDETLTASETLTTANADLTARNERLREVNSELFMKVGTSKENKGGNNQEQENKEGQENELTFDKLFDEKGDLL